MLKLQLNIQEIIMSWSHLIHKDKSLDETEVGVGKDSKAHDRMREMES